MYLVGTSTSYITVVPPSPRKISVGCNPDIKCRYVSGLLDLCLEISEVYPIYAKNKEQKKIIYV